jgi:plastocyanin
MTKLPLIAALLATAPAAALAADAAPSVTVKIHNMQFTPATLAIAAGTKVTWINEDAAPHTVTDRNRVFRSAALDNAESYSFTFSGPGDFTYYCTIHPMMVGRIIVK